MNVEITPPLREIMLPYKEELTSLLDQYGDYTYDQVVYGIHKGDFRFWPLEKSFVIATVDEFPQHRCLTISVSYTHLTLPTTPYV